MVNWPRLLLALAAIAGAASGPSSLESAAASQPSIAWGDLAFMAVGSIFALPVVLGFQALIGNFRALRWGWQGFLYVAIYLTVSGVSALVVSVRGPGLLPHSFLFLVLGVAVLLGLGIVRAIFGRKFVPSN